MKTVWITRTNVQKLGFSLKGWKAIQTPLLNVAPASISPSPPGPDDVLVFTSGNGVNLFCTYTDERHWPVYTVGDATAETARSAGFKNIISAGKDVTALHDLIANSPELKSKQLYYASGQDVSGNLVADLRAKGFSIERHILYETMPISRTPPAIETTLKKKGSLTVLLYSPKGAQAFRALDLDFRGIETISISANVDQILTGMGVKSRKIANPPTYAAMIKQLE